MPDVYSYGENVCEKFADIPRRIKTGSLIPHQVEIHPPPRGKELCWLRCKHCYTQTDLGESQRISGERLVEILDEISQGSPRTGERPEKIILSGFRTDPLNSDIIGNVVEASKQAGFVTGVHTKGLRMTEELIEKLTSNSHTGDYISFSVDAGNNSTYNKVHGVRNPQARLYEQVRENIQRLMDGIRSSNSNLQVRATYLLTNENCDQQVLDFIEQFRELCVHTMRFSVPILPTMGLQERVSEFPKVSVHDLADFEQRFHAMEREDRNDLVYLEFGGNTKKTLPCWSRWLLPTVGYDGHLYPCCLVASQEFEALRIADLTKEKFWDSYYKQVALDFHGTNCQCDRKAAEIHQAVSSRLEKSTKGTIMDTNS